MEQIALELAAIGLDLVKIKRLLDPLSKEQIQEVLRHQSEQELVTNCFEQAAARVQLNVLEYLLEKGADPNAPGTPSGTSLAYAASFNRLPVAKLLLRFGANIDARGFLNWTPLMSASGSGHTKMVKLLLEAGADVHATYTYPCAANQTRSGTLLHLAASSGNVAVVRLLLQEGVDVNATGGGPISPLHLCFPSYEKPKMKVAQCLIEYGADTINTTSFEINRLESLNPFQAVPVAGLRLSERLKLEACSPLESVRYATLGLEGRVSSKAMAVHRPQLARLRSLFPNMSFLSYPVKIRNKTYDIGHGAVTAQCLPALSDYRHALDILWVRFYGRQPIDPHLLTMAIALKMAGMDDLDLSIWRRLLREVVLTNCEHPPTHPAAL